MATQARSLPYEEPGMVTILINVSFLLILNIVNYVLDRVVYCGLLGQIFVGMAWGIPGAKWLDVDLQHVAMSIGYLGLVLLVYEGGLSTCLGPLRANLLLATAVALTGISLPIGLSFVLKSLASASPLQAFAAGAALCSTSLGTTFTVLETSGLTRTKLGTVLSSAAMMDDVVGLILVQVISNLGGPHASFSSVTVIRPLAVSVAFVLVLILVCRFLIAPVTRWVQYRWGSESRSFRLMEMYGQHVAFVMHTLVLVGLVIGATYAGTSGLFAAYLAGAAISWWDGEFLMSSAENNQAPSEETVREGEEATTDNKSESTPSGATRNNTERGRSSTEQNPNSQPVVEYPDTTHSTGTEVYHNYYSVVVQRILKPLFFASIGFAIPITQMFRGAIVWRGIVYTILMFIAKVLTGLWLVRLEISVPRISIPVSWKKLARSCRLQRGKVSEKPTPSGQQPGQSEGSSRPPNKYESTPSKPSSRWPKPRSLYPASILGTAMVARGEIGFLVSSLAESKGIFSTAGTANSDIYLIVTWAIMLCTMIGPLGVGMLVRRLKRLQKQQGTPDGGGGGGRGRGRGSSDPLGVWGVL
ncbi:Na+/H+ antiporter [Paecilomyces variotii No. 5]|uniref:Na+/H+ antiporter n=1 Tax=Byssochlamys spectabilis (strain No. 5 / NBRC 109023) TaxID=1356009 RepID=V5G6I2_BYSSN|nr:Na+/H+ antiporter [Paecilomyces variotii No. 5]